MATAPRPGVGERGEAANAAMTFLTITLKDQAPVTIAPGNVPFAERLLVRKATGLPFEAFFGEREETVGEDSIQVLWWLGRRAAGEWQLTLTRALEDWPVPLTPDLIDIEYTTPDQEKETSSPES